MTDQTPDQASDSRYAMYEGLIALAWADHELHKNEREALNTIIENHRGLSDEQRAQLKIDVETKVTLNEVWPRITNAQDRARLIDLAVVIFKQDGEYTADEREVKDAALAQHLEQINGNVIVADLRAYRDEQIEKNKLHAAEMEEYRKRFSLIEMIHSRFS